MNVKIFGSSKNKQTNKNSLWKKNYLRLGEQAVAGHEAKGSTQGETVRSMLNNGHERQVRWRKDWTWSLPPRPFSDHHKFSLQSIILEVSSVYFYHVLVVFLFLPGNKWSVLVQAFSFVKITGLCISPAAPYQCRIFVKYRKKLCFSLLVRGITWRMTNENHFSAIQERTLKIEMNKMLC